jgi:hypothetical protein
MRLAVCSTIPPRSYGTLVAAKAPTLSQRGDRVETGGGDGCPLTPRLADHRPFPPPHTAGVEKLPTGGRAGRRKIHRRATDPGAVTLEGRTACFALSANLTQLLDKPVTYRGHPEH